LVVRLAGGFGGFFLFVFTKVCWWGEFLIVCVCVCVCVCVVCVCVGCVCVGGVCVYVGVWGVCVCPYRAGGSKPRPTAVCCMNLFILSLPVSTVAAHKHISYHNNTLPTVLAACTVMSAVQYNKSAQSVSFLSQTATAVCAV
jgi:hypothetical protein